MQDGDNSEDNGETIKHVDNTDKNDNCLDDDNNVDEGKSYIIVDHNRWKCEFEIKIGTVLV